MLLWERSLPFIYLFIYLPIASLLSIKVLSQDQTIEQAIWFPHFRFPQFPSNSDTFHRLRSGGGCSHVLQTHPGSKFQLRSVKTPVIYTTSPLRRSPSSFLFRLRVASISASSTASKGAPVISHPSANGVTKGVERQIFPYPLEPVFQQFLSWLFEAAHSNHGWHPAISCQTSGKGRVNWYSRDKKSHRIAVQRDLNCWDSWPTDSKFSCSSTWSN